MVAYSADSARAHQDEATPTSIERHRLANYWQGWSEHKIRSLLQSFRQPHSIKWHLFSFAAALTLPILLLAAMVGWKYVDQEQRRFEDQSSRLVQEVASRIDSDFASFKATLDVLATSPFVINGELDQFSEHVKNAPLAGGDGWIVLRRRTGEILLDTSARNKKPLPDVSDPDMDRVVFEQRKTFVSNLLHDPTTGLWAVSLAAPLTSSKGETSELIQLIVPADYFESALKELQSPPGWILTINDRDGKILARSFRHSEVVGTAMAAKGWELTKNVAPGQGGIWRNLQSLEGRDVQGAYYRMISTGWLIGAAALPRVYAVPRRQAMILGGAITVLALASSVILATVFGRRLVRAIQTLETEAHALQQGSVPEVAATQLQEVNQVAQIMRETTDILRKREEHQQILLQELNHRVKNTLATVQALARRTFRGDPTGRYERFEGRLLSLSKTHNVLTASEWQGARVVDIIESELAPYKDHLDLKGPNLFLSTRVALSLSMILHELATNAAKYGAFSVASGHTSVVWEVRDNRFQLHWIETGGPPVTAPVSQGFGTTLIAHTVERELQGAITFDYANTGLQCRLIVPFDHVPVYRKAT